jgi:hypothetical protein
MMMSVKLSGGRFKEALKQKELEGDEGTREGMKFWRGEESTH